VIQWIHDDAIHPAAGTGRKFIQRPQNAKNDTKYLIHESRQTARVVSPFYLPFFQIFHRLGVVWNWLKRENFEREKKENQQNERKKVELEENSTVIEALPLDLSYS
jgi:hypothetical protein